MSPSCLVEKSGAAVVFVNGLMDIYSILQAGTTICPGVSRCVQYVQYSGVTSTSRAPKQDFQTGPLEFYTIMDKKKLHFSMRR